MTRRHVPGQPATPVTRPVHDQDHAVALLHPDLDVVGVEG